MASSGRWLVLAVLALGVPWRGTECGEEEVRLYAKLLSTYNPLERPVKEGATPVVVKLGVILQQLIDVDEKNQIVEVNAWLKYTWTDYKLVWDPVDYGNISGIRFPTGKLWKPDVLLYNSVDSNFDSTYPTHMLAYSNGIVTWIPPGIFKISCKINIAWFPFDEQSCYFKFGSWTYDGWKLDLQPDENGFDISEYLLNGEWTLMNATVARSVKYYDCCPEPYPDLKFLLRMRRRTIYYGFNFIIPCILITLMTLLGFTLPPDAGEKITLRSFMRSWAYRSEWWRRFEEITVMLSICFFLSIVASMTPPTSEAVPLLGVFFSSCMIVVSLSTFVTVYVLNLHYRTPETHTMGPFTRAILLQWLPFILQMHRPGHKLKPPIPWAKSADQPPRDAEAERDADVEARVHRCFKRIADSAMSGGGDGLQIDVGRQIQLLLLQRIQNELKFVTRRMREADAQEAVENDWKFAAMVVDRLCLVVFTAGVFFATCTLLTAPYLVA